MSIDEQLGVRFVCAKCKSTGGKSRRIAMSGTGLTKILDIQHNQFITVSCLNCGYTEVYNPEALEDKRQLGTILDVIFGS